MCKNECKLRYPESKDWCEECRGMTQIDNWIDNYKEGLQRLEKTSGHEFCFVCGTGTKTIQEIEKIASQKTLKDALIKLPAKFWDDQDHAVGGYISKKDLLELITK